MARAFGASFAALMGEQFIPGVFWTLKLTFPEPWGEQYFSDRSVTVDGNAHEALVTGWGDIASLTDREEKRWDISLVTVEFTNFPVMSTGERLSDLFTEDLETVPADIFLNLKDSDGTIHQELMFRGLIQTPISYDYERASLTVMALSEAYLNKSVLRVVTREDFPAMREADIGATIPIAVGTVERSPGRVVKASAKTAPVADPNNTSSAKLLDFQASADAVSQDWEITVLDSGAENVSNKAINTEAELGKPAGTVAFDAASTGFTNSGTSVTFSHTVGGTRPVLLVFVSLRSATVAVSSVTYGGTALTQLARRTGSGIAHEIWYLAVPAAGAANVVVTVGSAVAFTAIAESITNGNFANQNTVEGFSTATQGTSISVANAIYSSKLALDLLTSTGNTAVTVGSGQTERANVVTTNAVDGDNVRSVTSTKPTDAQGFSMSWSSSFTRHRLLSVVPFIQNKEQWAQSFQTTAGQLVSGIRLRARRNTSAIQGTVRLHVHLKADDSGKPAKAALAYGFADVSATTAAIVTIQFTEPVAVSAATTYWITVVDLTQEIITQDYGTVLIGRHASSQYAGGKAIRGHQKQFGFGVNPEIEWDTTDRGELWFEVLFESGAYEFFGSVTGFDGTGSVASDSVSDSGQITLLASHWQGTPAAGDVFRFSVDNSENKVIFSESPSDTPVSEIGTVFWNDVAVEDPSASSSIGAALTNFGDETNSAVATKLTVDVGGLYKSIEMALAKVGAPDQAVSLQVREAIGSIPSGVVLASIEIAPAGVTSSAAFVSGVFDEPVALEAGTYFLVASTGQSDAANYYKAYRASGVSGGLADVGAKEAAGAWSVLASTGHAAKLTAATLNKQASIDDGTGQNVASVGFDVPIPDFAAITANLLGIEDDLSGTYTGTASALIRRPDALIHWLAIRAGVSTAEIDLAGTFADSGSSYGGLYLFDGLIQDSETYKRLFLRLAFECRSAVDWPVDTLQLKFLPLRVTTADRTIAYANLVAERNKPLLVVSRTDTTKLVNFVDVRFQRVARSIRELTAYARVVNARNTDSIERFGQREDPELFFMDFTGKEDMATDQAEYYANRLSNPRQIVDVTLKYPFLDVEKDDSAAFNLVKVVGV